MAIATFAAWLLAIGQTPKTYVMLASFPVTVIILISCVAYVFSFKAKPALIIVAACLSIGGCVGERQLIIRDHARIIAEMRLLTCSEAEQILRTGHGLGREWKANGWNQWESRTTGFTRYYDLFLFHNPDTDYFDLRPGGIGDESGSAQTSCGPGSDSPLPDVALGPRA